MRGERPDRPRGGARVQPAAGVLAAPQHRARGDDGVVADVRAAEDDRVGRHQHVAPDHHGGRAQRLAQVPAVRAVGGVVGVGDRDALAEPRAVADDDPLGAGEDVVVADGDVLADRQIAVGLQHAAVAHVRPRADRHAAAAQLHARRVAEPRRVADRQLAPPADLEHERAAERDVAAQTQGQVRRAAGQVDLDVRRRAQARAVRRVEDQPPAVTAQAQPQAGRPEGEAQVAPRPQQPLDHGGEATRPPPPAGSSPRPRRGPGWRARRGSGCPRRRGRR